MADRLSRRERQILDILHRRRAATVAQVQAEMSDPPSYDGVRTILRMLERKGAIRHRQDGPRYLYSPVEPLEKARTKALEHLVGTFFGGSTSRAAAALLSLDDAALDESELAAIRVLLDRQEET